MKHTITQAPGISTLEIDADLTLTTGGGLLGVGFFVGQFQRGWPGRVMSLTADTFKKAVGKPWPSKEGPKAEAYRVLNDAIAELAYCDVVPVCAVDAKYPVLTGSFAAGAGAVAASSRGFATEPTAGADGVVLVIYPVDGDPSTGRTVKIGAVNDADETFAIEFFDTDDNGDTYSMYGKAMTVSLKPDARDDMGVPAFIEVVLEARTAFRCDVDTGVTWANAKLVLAAFDADGEAFLGGTRGGDPEAADWQEAWDIAKNESYNATLMFTGGCYDTTVLAYAGAIAESRRCHFFADAPPTLTKAQAVAWVTAAGFNNRCMRFTYCPWSATDPYYGGRAVWGAAGAKVAATAKGFANYTGITPGVHYAPAGAQRAKLTRTGVKPLFDGDHLAPEAFVAARLNPVVPCSGGGAMIGDDLSQFFKENYLRFGWVNQIANQIEREFAAAVEYTQFEPDAETRANLTRIMVSIMERYVASGALVPPRDPSFGKEPYRVEIVQPEIDLWLVTWEFCPTGSARRIAGQPILLP